MIPLATIEAYASQAIGTPVTISCESPFPADYAGYVIGTASGGIANIIHLPADTCSQLENIATAQTIEGDDFLALMHEDEHIHLQSTNECDVERAAAANVWQIVRLFKLAAWRARAILAGSVIADSILPAAYHAGCSS